MLNALGDHLRRRRLNLGQTQRTLASALGVRTETIRLWGSGSAKPLPRHFGRIVEFLGTDPDPAGESLGARLRAVGRRAGLTQAELAAALGLDEGTLIDLGAGRRRTSRRVAEAIAAFLARAQLGALPTS
jgi:transcriptional regulator with XRE-family HTH domain